MRTITYSIHTDEHPNGQTIYSVVETEVLHTTTGDERFHYVLPFYHTTRAEAQAAIEELAQEAMQ